MGVAMRRNWFPCAAGLAAFLILSSAALARPAGTLPIPGYGAAKAVPGAKELPNPNVTYKVIFDIGKSAPKIDQVNPGLIVVARYFNTLAEHGVPADHL